MAQFAQFAERVSLPPPAAQWSGGRGPAARQGGGRLPPYYGPLDVVLDILDRNKKY